MINPLIGTLMVPKSKPQKKLYPALAEKLMNAVDASIPREKRDFLRFPCTLKGPPLIHFALAHQLSLCVFLLSEYVDADHPLVKIATLTDFDEFRAAVEAL